MHFEGEPAASPDHILYASQGMLVNLKTASMAPYSLYVLPLTPMNTVSYTFGLDRPEPLQSPCHCLPRLQDLYELPHEVCSLPGGDTGCIFCAGHLCFLELHFFSDLVAEDLCCKIKAIMGYLLGHGESNEVLNQSRDCHARRQWRQVLLENKISSSARFCALTELALAL